MQTTPDAGFCDRPCQCGGQDILDLAPCPPSTINYMSFCEFAKELNLPLCVTNKIAESCSIPKPWSCTGTSTTGSTVSHSTGSTVIPTTTPGPGPDQAVMVLVIGFAIIVVTVMVGVLIVAYRRLKAPTLNDSVTKVCFISARVTFTSIIPRIRRKGPNLHRESKDVKNTYENRAYSFDETATQQKSTEVGVLTGFQTPTNNAVQFFETVSLESNSTSSVVIEETGAVRVDGTDYVLTRQGSVSRDNHKNVVNDGAYENIKGGHYDPNGSLDNCSKAVQFFETVSLESNSSSSVVIEETGAVRVDGTDYVLTRQGSVSRDNHKNVVNDGAYENIKGGHYDPNGSVDNCSKTGTESITVEIDQPYQNVENTTDDDDHKNENHYNLPGNAAEHSDAQSDDDIDVQSQEDDSLD